MTSSLVPQACLHPNSEKDQKKGKIKLDKELDKKIFKMNENSFSLREFFQKLLVCIKPTLFFML